MTKDLVNILDGFKDKKILVLGDIILDRFIWGDIERINPEQRAAPLVKVKYENYVLGGAANVANNITSLGGKCDLWGAVGKGVNGDKVRELCKKNHIGLVNFYDKNPTIVKMRAMADRQQITRLDFGEYNLKKIDKETERSILDSLNKNVKDYDFIILSDYDKTLFTQGLSYNLIGITNNKKIGTLADIKPKNLNFFKGCTIVCPNKHEAEEMSGIRYHNGNETLKKISESITNKIKSEYVIITCGEDGAFLYGKENIESKQIPTRAREVKDVTGAGDTFAAALALSLACKKDIYSSVELANYAAGIVCGKAGTATVTIDEIKEYINRE